MVRNTIREFPKGIQARDTTPDWKSLFSQAETCFFGFKMRIAGSGAFAGRIREVAREERGQPCPRELDLEPGTRGHGCPRSNLESALGRSPRCESNLELKSRAHV